MNNKETKFNEAIAKRRKVLKQEGREARAKGITICPYVNRNDPYTPFKVCAWNEGYGQ